MSDNGDTETVVPAASERSSSRPPSSSSYEVQEWSKFEISEAQEFLDSVKDFFTKTPEKYDSFHALSYQRATGEIGQQSFWAEAKKLLSPALMNDLRQFMPKSFIPIDEFPHASVLLMGRDRGETDADSETIVSEQRSSE